MNKFLLFAGYGMTDKNMIEGAPSKGKESILKVIADYAADCEKDFDAVQRRAHSNYLKAIGGTTRAGKEEERR